MKKSYSHVLAEGCMFIVLFFGLILIANAQDAPETPGSDEPRKTVKVEVEVTENGKTSRTVQELELNRESINGQLDEMVEEIEMILEEAVRDIEETDLQVTIRRNVNEPDHHWHYRFHHDVMRQAYAPDKRAFLGVYLEAVEEEDASEMGISGGAEISGLVDGAPAQAAGLQEGDIITAIDGQEVAGYSEAVRIVRSKEVGQVVELTYVRDGEEHQTEVELGEQSVPLPPCPPQPPSVHRTFLGVVGKSPGEEDGAGVLLTEIVEGSSAQKAGLEEGDVITVFDGKEVTSFSELSGAIRTREPGEEVEVRLVRDGKEQTVTVELGERKHAPQPAYNYHYNYDYSWNGLHAKKHCDREVLEKKPFLGVRVSNPEGEREKGVKVTRVFEGSSAETLGLQEGDIIYEVNNEEVEDVEDLVNTLETMEVGEEVKVKYFREGKKGKASGSLGSRADCKEMTDNARAWEKTIRLRTVVEEAEAEEIRDLSEKSGEELDAGNSLEVSDLSYVPNPTEGLVQLKFELPGSGDVRIAIFDGNGRKVYREDLSDFSGSYSNEIDLGNGPAGLYFISITQNGKGKVARLIRK